MARQKEEITVLIENARIIFRNFAGVQKQFNKAGDRNFSVVLDDKLAQRLIEDGWNVKWLKAREEGDQDQPHLPVALRFDVRAPRVVLVTGDNRTFLDEDSVAVIDTADIENVDLIIRAFDWSRDDGASGRKAYLKSIYVTIHEDELERKYAHPNDDPTD
jgi:hypothetical protein